MSAATTDLTQVIQFPMNNMLPLDPAAPAGPVYELLKKGLEILKTPGTKRVYWGRRLEDQVLHIHVVYSSLLIAKEFLDSPTYQVFLETIKPLTMGAVTVRHAYLAEYNEGCQALAKGSPFTGTAYYLSPFPASSTSPNQSPPSWDTAWAFWATVISRVPGFMGISGGPVVEPIDGCQTAFLVFVGWESVKHHDEYHHTEEFARLRGVLIEPTQGKGYAYYGHVRFCNEETGAQKSKVQEAPREQMPLPSWSKPVSKI